MKFTSALELLLLAAAATSSVTNAFTANGRPSFAVVSSDSKSQQRRPVTVEQKQHVMKLYASAEDSDDVGDDDISPSDVESEEEESAADDGDDDGDDTSPSDVETEEEDEKSSSIIEEVVEKVGAVAGRGENLSFLQTLGAISGRGEFATKGQKEAAEQAMRELETSNTMKEPVNSDTIQGQWTLVYSSTQLFRSSPFFMAGRAVCKTEEERKQYDWFCDMHRKALAISQIGPVRQIISNDKLVSEFEVYVGAVPFLSDFTPFTYSGGLPFTIEGALVSSADITPNSDGSGWELYMDTVEVKGSNIPVLRQILDNDQVKLESRKLADVLEQNVKEYTTPRPIFETTYLDDKFRLSRDQDGNAFFYVKTSESTTVTDYSVKDSDLGVGKLLEGFNDAITKFYL